MALRKKHREAEVSTDSLNDIMFFLLLFFLILSTMVSPNAIKVNLPSSQSRETIDNTKKPLHLAITKDKKYYVNSKEVQLTDLEKEISAYASTQTEPVVLMHLDKELSIQDEIDIMTICYKLNCKTVLATAATKK
ncbi:MAG: biopolymer transporter ExbD [Bacteroidia bacterium]|nr:biopolymer transporter ExbD [Bacteroidia bacterium]